MRSKSGINKLFFILILAWQYTEAVVRMSHISGVLENFGKFWKLTLCQSHFLIKLEASGTVVLQILQIFRNFFFIEELWTTTSKYIFPK